MWRETRDSARNPLTRQAPGGYFPDTLHTGTLQPVAGRGRNFRAASRLR